MYLPAEHARRGQRAKQDGAVVRARGRHDRGRSRMVNGFGSSLVMSVEVRMRRGFNS